MAEQADNSTEEAISGQEGAVSTIENATQEEETPEEVVPKRDLMRVKDDRDKLKARVKELEAERGPKSSIDIESLKAKYQGVDADFLEDVAAIIEKKAEEKLAPVRNQQKQETFEKQFTALYNDQLAKAEGIDVEKVDKSVIKALALSPQYRNVPIKDIVEKLYKVETRGRSTTENDMRPATDLVSDVVSTDRPIERNKMEKIFKDPQAVKEFLAKKYS